MANKTRRFVGASRAIFAFLLLMAAWASAGEARQQAAQSLVAQMGEFLYMAGGAGAEWSGKALYVGQPVELWRVDRQTALAYQGSRLLPDLLVPSSNAMVPIYVNGELSAFVRVVKGPGGWRPVKLGYKALAREMRQVQEAWPLGEGHRVALVENEARAEFFFSVVSQPNANLNPMRYMEDTTAQAKYGTLYSPDAVVRSLVELAWGGSYEIR